MSCFQGIYPNKTTTHLTPWSIKDYLSMMKIKKRIGNVNLQVETGRLKNKINCKSQEFIKMKIKERLPKKIKK